MADTPSREYLKSHGIDGTGTLQFGIEIEFCIPPTEYPITQEHPACVNADLAHLDMAKALQAEGLNTAVELESLSFPGCEGRNPVVECAAYEGLREDFKVMDTRSMAGRAQAVFPYRHWVVKGEDDLDTPEGRLLNWIPTELNTPILTQQEAELGLKNVNTALTAIHHQCLGQIHIGEKNYGLHVHVSPTAGLTLRQARRIVTLTWLLEPDLLFSLCPEARQEVNPPLAKNARFIVEAPQHQADPAKSYPEMREDVPIPLIWAHGNALTRIYDAANLVELSEIVKGRNLAHPGMDECFENLGLVIRHHCSDHNKETVTVEFRHAQSSFSQKFIREWVALVLNITKVALLTPTEYKKMLLRIWELVSEPEAQGGWVCLFTMIKRRLQFEWDVDMDERFWLQRTRESSTFQQ
ncbi:hypothetical protein S40293_01487 [Stachybotrys chartarum IBT 40293]|nr:hypothetical protein S40293_01487 [Stachybotrys chartarum IBT 40293]